MTTVIYTKNILYSGNRPYADVILVSTPGNTPTYKSLVDTGADYLQLPETAANLAGISLIGGKKTTVQGISGSATMTLVSSVQITIEGIAVTVSVLFDPNAASKPILGRQALMAAMDVGFNTKEWLWK
jgi:predicted aspartyl protease